MKINKNIGSIVLIILFICLSIFQLSKAENKDKKNNKQLAAKLTSANNTFAFKIFNEVFKDDTEENIFISPLSISAALTMTYNGAKGNTEKAIAKTLGFNQLKNEEINKNFKIVIENLTANNAQVQFNIANSLWANKNLKFKDEFLNINKKFYNAKITNLDFKDKKSPSVINDWVSKQTQGKIKEIIKSISPQSFLFLINAVYFKASWQFQFDKTKTKEEDFTLLNGNKKLVQMMHQFGNFLYYENEKFQAISLPYGNGNMSMYIFLPSKNLTLKEIYKDLNIKNWKKWLADFHKEEVYLALPRFKIEYEKKLNGNLKNLGMGIAFNKSADFSDMSGVKNIFIDEIAHKTFVDVNEEGTEAAAATSVEMIVADGGHKYYMTVDHPFLFVIRDNKTGIILFIGSVVEPH